MLVYINRSASEVNYHPVSSNSNLITYESFMLINPISEKDDLPEFDQLYYETLSKQLEHLLYKYQEGWIKSSRQVFLTSDECISSIHFNFTEDDKVRGINVFQRSSNVDNLEEDIQFFSYFIKNVIPKYFETENFELTHFVSNPHRYLKGNALT